jgi:putative oxidoreductase
MSFGIAILRAVIGGLFIGHGLQKLLGKFGGHGLEGTAGWMESVGMRPGKVQATAAGVAETGGGALLVAGAATPLASAALTGSMTVAIAKVHGANGVWSQNGGYEFPLVMSAALFAITASGPGSLSVDRRDWGTPWALAALGAGVAGGYGMMELSKRTPEPEPAPATSNGQPVPEPVGSAN